MGSNIEPESTSFDKDLPSGVQVQTLESSDLGPVPTSRRSKIKAALKSLTTRDGWLGDYDYGALFIPNIPYLVKNKRELPFYGVNEKLPHMLLIILGLQHALAMVGGLVTPPLLLAGPAGAALGTESQLYLVSACLIWCALGTTIQVSRFRIPKTGYFFGTGLISVTGTSFAFTDVALSYLAQSYENGTCSYDTDGVTKLPCPEEFGAILGTATATGAFAILMAFVPPRFIRKLFPPLVTGTMLLFIGAALVKSGVTNWAGGSGSCASDHTLLCSVGRREEFWGSGAFLGLGFSCFAVILICEIFGSAFMKSASVFLGLITGLIIAAATGFFDSATIHSAPSGNFLWTHTWSLHVRGQLVLPMIAAWAVIVAETIGNVTASSDVSRLEITGDTFMSRVQGGVLADAVVATVGGLATVPPLTTFSQNSGVIALTRNASRSSGYMCAFILFLMGVIGKFGAIFVAAPSSVIGGFTTFLFGAVAVSGIRVLAYAKWTRRDRFIATSAFALGLASLTVPSWFSYIFTYKGNNAGIQGITQAVVLIVEEPYLIAALVAVVLNATLQDEAAEEPIEGEEERKTWNQPIPLAGTSEVPRVPELEV
ncbi:permease family-domain-containing protein [Naematelia encephala]|uniref:Permease family-domain-containing protein n=1 Tax=Naematelia encephala TaxID=71784 RepID=A0A1Y2AEU0_9TREE|nr:permease family-domain-containing protein [Naematelia encephala]